MNIILAQHAPTVLLGMVSTPLPMTARHALAMNLALEMIFVNHVHQVLLVRNVSHVIFVMVHV